jgi:hypothetical protein
MEATEIVRKIQTNKPVDRCAQCKEFWHTLGDSYELWYQAPNDGMAQVLVEASLDVYLRHRDTHETVIEGGA